MGLNTTSAALHASFAATVYDSPTHSLLSASSSGSLYSGVRVFRRSVATSLSYSRECRVVPQSPSQFSARRTSTCQLAENLSFRFLRSNLTVFRRAPPSDIHNHEQD